jgi:hypothetical protein
MTKVPHYHTIKVPYLYRISKPFFHDEQWKEKLHSITSPIFPPAATHHFPFFIQIFGMVRKSPKQKEFPTSIYPYTHFIFHSQTHLAATVFVWMGEIRQNQARIERERANQTKKPTRMKILLTLIRFLFITSIEKYFILLGCEFIRDGTLLLLFNFGSRRCCCYFFFDESNTTIYDTQCKAQLSHVCVYIDSQSVEIYKK